MATFQVEKWLEFTFNGQNGCVFALCSICIYGGGDRSKQIEAVRRGVEIIIGRYV